MELEKAIPIVTKLLDARKQLRRLLGENYAAAVDPWKSTILQAAGRQPIMSVCLEILKSLDKKNAPPAVGLAVMAATVEVIEDEK